MRMYMCARFVYSACVLQALRFARKLLASVPLHYISVFLFENAYKVCSSTYLCVEFLELDLLEAAELGPARLTKQVARYLVRLALRVRMHAHAHTHARMHACKHTQVT